MVVPPFLLAVCGDGEVTGEIVLSLSAGVVVSAFACEWSWCFCVTVADLVGVTLP